MKVKYSIIACILISLTFVSCRFAYTDYGNGKPLKITTWDALGYYMYLPATIIYNDASALEWFPEIDSTYDVSGGKLYQANKNEDGKYVFKYLGGIAVLQLPFFLASHVIAQSSAYAADGFSAPYQYGMAFGALVYFILTIFLLRHLLLKYFSDKITALSLILLFGASNIIQYV
ncbi:hypothetical protein N8368_03245, partial [Bacteroidia bacterium]|nr:hypothetical protein [Bacteroidia bacterium]